MNTAIRLIKTQEDYETALARVDVLMDAEPDTPEGDELEVLAALIEMYEDKVFPIGLPSVAEAIKFRMDQMDLRPRDLVPYIGSAARVSEVLAGKRPLTLKMARALHTGLDIPAEVLLQDEGAELPDENPAYDWSKFPLAAMAKAGWFAGFNGTAHDAKERAEELVQARVMALAAQKPLSSPYQPGTVTVDFIREAARLSYLDEGPRLVGDFLGKSGIHFVVLFHLPRTHLDGAAMWATDGKPLVALTLRHDRLDNFWFCLAHELAHVALHLEGNGRTPFFDDLDLMGDALDGIEREADDMAQQALIDEEAWKSSAASHTGHPRDVRVLAKVLRIHPAIVAGRVRHDTRNYRALTRFVGLGEVRKHFPEAATGA
ncbi:MAG: hypothetical protein F8N15_03565 [Methanobacterium sp.]|nr:hypothetical protein [Methanobacterium sp.]